MLTGRLGSRTGVGRWIQPKSTRWFLHLDETTLPEMLARAPVRYANSGVGKWHLVGWQNHDDPALHPLDSGFDWYSGTLANPDNSFSQTDDPRGYFWYEKAVNGSYLWTDTYMTTDVVDDAIERIEAMPSPWFLWLAFNAPHAPLHHPPPALHGLTLDDDATAPELFAAMSEALDTELGRLLAQVPPETTIVLVGDNGTPQHAILPPHDPDRSKGSLFEGGVNVPLIVAGRAVQHPGSESHALVHVVDLFPTLAELAGVELASLVDPRTGAPVGLDGRSLVAQLDDPDAPGHDVIFTEKFSPAGAPPHTSWDFTLRDDRHKMVANQDGEVTGFFAVQGPYDEGPDLLELGLTAAEEDKVAYFWAELAVIREDFRHDGIAAGR